MVMHSKSIIVAAVTFNVRSHTLILNLMYETNMHLMKMMYDIWYLFVIASLIIK